MSLLDVTTAHLREMLPFYILPQKHHRGVISSIRHAKFRCWSQRITVISVTAGILPIQRAGFSARRGASDIPPSLYQRPGRRDRSLGDQGTVFVSARVNISGGWWEPHHPLPPPFLFLLSLTRRSRHLSCTTAGPVHSAATSFWGLAFTCPLQTDANLTENSLLILPPFRYTTHAPAPFLPYLW